MNIGDLVVGAVAILVGVALALGAVIERRPGSKYVERTTRNVRHYGLARRRARAASDAKVADGIRLGLAFGLGMGVLLAVLGVIKVATAL